MVKMWHILYITTKYINQINRQLLKFLYLHKIKKKLLENPFKY